MCSIDATKVFTWPIFSPPPQKKYCKSFVAYNTNAIMVRKLVVSYCQCFLYSKEIKLSNSHLYNRKPKTQQVIANGYNIKIFYSTYNITCLIVYQYQLIAKFHYAISPIEILSQTSPFQFQLLKPISMYLLQTYNVMKKQKNTYQMFYNSWSNTKPGMSMKHTLIQWKWCRVL